MLINQFEFFLFLFLAYNSQNKGGIPGQQLLTKQLLNQSDVLFSFSQTLLTLIQTVSLQFTLKVEQIETQSEIRPPQHSTTPLKHVSPPTRTTTDEVGEGWHPINGEGKTRPSSAQSRDAFQQGSQLRATAPLCFPIVRVHPWIRERLLETGYLKVSWNFDEVVSRSCCLTSVISWCLLAHTMTTGLP